jgi:hypothetical protein
MMEIRAKNPISPVENLIPTEKYFPATQATKVIKEDLLLVDMG